MGTSHKDLHSKLTLGGLLISLGIIYGDIGTSPLYVMKAIFGNSPINSNLVLGAVSCVLWTLTLQTSIKYVWLTLQADNIQVFKALLMKNRDIIHGAFALTEDGSKVIFRYTLQIHNLDFNEFDAALNSLSLLLSEYSDQLIKFSK